QAIGRRLLQDVGDEGELPLADAALILAVPARLLRIGAEIFDIVEHEEQRPAMLEGVIGWPEGALEGLARIPRVRRLEIEIVIAADVEPRKADLADDPV